MKFLTRREFGYLTGGIALAARGPRLAASEAKPRVVVVGGGIGGATAAKYLATGARTIEVTLVEPRPHYTTCFFSNLYLAGLCSLESLKHGYETLAQRYGINVIHDSVTAVDPVAKTVELKNGPKLPCDRVVVAPGIAFDYEALAGYDEAATQVIPHAWNAGPQTQLLRRQLESMEDGGVFVLVAPPNPFRCPPAPYERASLVAYYFKQHKPRSRILILDAKDSFNSQDLFLDGWERHYRGMIEWLPAQFTGGINAIDVKERSVKTASDTFKAAVANVIPPQKASQFAQQIGLVDQSGWCPVDPITFESKLQPGIHVVGDATSAGDMPKSAFVANSQAKACAFSITAALAGSVRQPPHLFNTCYTFLSPDDAVSNAVSFKPAAGTIKIVDNFVSQVQESAETRRRAAREAQSWYAAFTRDTFG